MTPHLALAGRYSMKTVLAVNSYFLANISPLHHVFLQSVSFLRLLLSSVDPAKIKFITISFLDVTLYCQNITYEIF
jgi:hypothetical protein